MTQVLNLSESIKNQIPANIDYDQTAKILSVDPSPLNVVLLQEVGTSHALATTHIHFDLPQPDPVRVAQQLCV